MRNAGNKVMLGHEDSGHHETQIPKGILGDEWIQEINSVYHETRRHVETWSTPGGGVGGMNEYLAIKKHRAQ